MSMNDPQENTGPVSQRQNFSTFVSTHNGLVIGGGIILLLILAGMFMNSKNKTAPATTAVGDLSGLTGGKVYVPTSTNFTTENIKYGPQSGDPNLTSITNSPVNIQSGNPTTTTINKPTTTTTTTNNNPIIPTRTPPVGTPPPPTHGKGLIWDQRHAILGGETLSGIAASLTRTLRAQGMPGSMSVTWNDLYGHNQAVVQQYANAHGFHTDYWNWIFPGESITTPRWG
jgi:hypothetical protein